MLAVAVTTPMALVAEQTYSPWSSEVMPVIIITPESSRISVRVEKARPFRLDGENGNFRGKGKKDIEVSWMSMTTSIHLKLRLQFSQIHKFGQIKNLRTFFSHCQR